MQSISRSHALTSATNTLLCLSGTQGLASIPLLTQLAWGGA